MEFIMWAFPYVLSAFVGAAIGIMALCAWGLWDYDDEEDES